MAKFKSLTVGQRLATAGRQRKCYHSAKHNISKGDGCLETRDGMAWKGYCIECGIEMVNQAIQELQELHSALVAEKNSSDADSAD